jgi:hypothetical protein
MNPPVNTYDPASLLPNLRAFFVTAGIARIPAVAGSEAPCWLDPLNGIPYPGQTDGLGPNENSVVNKASGLGGLVLCINPETGIVPIAHEGFYQRRAVMIWYRSMLSPEIQNAHEQVRSAIQDKRNYSLNGLQVNQSLMMRELQRVASNAQGYVYNTEYLFDLWGDDDVLAS